MRLGIGYGLLSALRWFPRFRGKHRLASRMSGWLPDRADVVVRGPDGSHFLVPSLKEPIAFEILIHGNYEADTLKFIKRHLRRGDTFIDVGANIGAFALPASRIVGPTGRVFAVEASARVFPYLESNLRTNGVTNVTAIHGAAGVQDGGELTFFDAPPQKFGMGSRAPWNEEKGYTVAARSIDTVLGESGTGNGRVRLLKIDVEGFELDVLRGATALLNGPSPPIVVFEFIDWAERRAGTQLGDAQRYLIAAGFTLHTLSAYSAGGPELKNIITEGAEMLVATKHS